jgi:hypothetical protein
MGDHGFDRDQIGLDEWAGVLGAEGVPELWRRFTIALRRAVSAQLKTAGVNAGEVRVSFVKAVELQARAIPHIHALIRLDPPPADTTGSGDCDSHGPAAPWGGGEPRPIAHQDSGWSSPITATDLAALIQRAARHVSIDVTSGGDANQDAERALRFGTQIDTQPLTPETITAATDPGGRVTAGTVNTASSRLSPRRVAAYLAKYVTKSLHGFGITARRLSAEAIGDLDVTEHVRAILSAIAELAEHTAEGGSLAGIGRWLHTLGYRGHITTKSRHYSTTMGALRAARATWTRHQMAKHSGQQDDTQSAHSADDVRASTGGRHEPIDTDEMLWEFDRAGHTSAGDRVLVVSAALRHIGARITGVTESRTDTTRIPPTARAPG